MNVSGEESKKTGTAPAKKEGTAPAKHTDSIGAMIEKLKPQLARALPKHVTPDRLARVALTAIRNNPNLARADAMSLMGSIMTAAQLGVEPNTPLGQAYLIPYGNQVQFQLGYKGLLDIALRTGQYKRISAHEVDEADHFEYEFGLDEKLIHKPAQKPTGNSIYFYAVYELDNGGKSFVVWSRDKVEAHAKKYSKAYNTKDTPWKSAFDQMAKKTVLIDLLRYAPKSVEIQKATISDNMTMHLNPDDPDLNIDISADFEVEE